MRSASTNDAAHSLRGEALDLAEQRLGGVDVQVAEGGQMFSDAEHVEEDELDVSRFDR
jgi:hypothetical protein